MTGDRSGTIDDVKELNSIIQDLGQCGGPRTWHLEDLINIVIRMRLILGEVLQELP